MMPRMFTADNFSVGWWAEADGTASLMPRMFTADNGALKRAKDYEKELQ